MYFNRDKLFTKFHRIEERGELTFEGMGLGLYLIKRIIQKQGGDIHPPQNKKGLLPFNQAIWPILFCERH